jgi:hypothetical protein
MATKTRNAVATEDQAATAVAAPETPLDGTPIEKSIRWLTLGLTVAIFCALAWPMLHRQIYTHGDLKNSFAVIRHHYSEALRAGDDFLWEPELYCGSDIYAAGESGMCHPLQWLLYKTLPFDVAFNAEFLFNYAWLCLGTYLLLRYWRLPRGAALFGAALFSVGGTNLFHFVHLARLDTMRSMPWVLLLTDIVMCSRRWKAVVLAQAGISLLTASALIGGSSHYYLYTMLAQAVCIACRLWTQGGYRRVLLLAVSEFLGAVAAAVQLIPSVEGVMEMERSQDPLLKLWFSLHPANLLQLVSPYLFLDRFCSYSHAPIEGNTHEFALYCTAFGTVALAWLWMRREALRPQRLFLRVVFFSGVAALITALGKYGVVYVFLAEIPFLDKFKCSCRYIVLVHLAMTILACVALTDMFKVLRDKVQIPWRKQWPLLVPLGLSAAAFLGACYFVLLPHPEHPYATQLSRSLPETFLGLASIAAVVACCAAVARGEVWGIGGIVVLTFAEIAYGLVWEHVWSHGMATVDEIIAQEPKPPTKDGRLLSYKSLQYDNALMMGGYEYMQGYSHAPTLRLMYKAMSPMIVKDESGVERQVSSPMLLKMLQVAGTRWVEGNGNNGWMEVPGLLPRARLVADAVVTEDELPVFARIDPARTAIIDQPAGELTGLPGTARITSDRPGRVEIDTDAPGRQILVWAERYNAGWNVTVDGQPAQLLRTYGDFLGCAVGPGKQHVVFHYQPASFARGLRITLAALCAIAALAGVLCVPIGGTPRRSLAAWIIGDAAKTAVP